MKHTFYLSLGSNIGERLHYLSQACDQIEQVPEIALTAVSNIYETVPVGFTEQPGFLNMAVKGLTSLDEVTLLYKLQEIELKLGRTREIYWGPRTIDIDLLIYDNIKVRSEQLIIPHPRMHERAFVLVPLIEIADELVIPGTAHYIKNFVGEVEGEGVQLWRKTFKDGDDVLEHLESLKA
jgi:2-amino-4-hydroxy-6-hydroxymethyldihydropteridine diphosphokinase